MKSHRASQEENTGFSSPLIGYYWRRGSESPVLVRIRPANGRRDRAAKDSSNFNPFQANHIRSSLK